AKGHETAARARFREALAQVRNLNLAPEKFAPRVIEAFEKAREEMTAGAPNAKKKSHKGLLIGAGIVAGGGGVAAALAGGASSSPAAGTSRPCPGPPTLCGQLSPAGASAQHLVGPFGAGSCQAR